MFTINAEGVDMDELILDMIDYGVEDEYDEDEEGVTIYGDPKSFNQIQKALEEKGIEIKGSELTRIPNDVKELNDEQRATIDKLIERIEEDEDVQNVYHNMKID